ncbi:MAG: protein kinase [Thermodesulfobacteriota bacterium]
MDNKPRLVSDTSDFFSIDKGDELVIGGRRYEILGHARELRFGIEDPKFWVKRAIDVDTRERKLIKLAFFESFTASLGGVKIKCFRDPEKEGKILSLVKGRPDFMQGEVFYDDKGNNIRVLDIVRGESFMNYIGSLSMPYETYFKNMLPDVLRNLVKSLEAIRFLHANGFKHGDIRNDHLFVENRTGNYVWIDFDYDFQSTENPFSLDVFGLGNVLSYAVGMGFHNYYMIKTDRFKYGDLADRVEPEDFALLDPRRFINLAKLYPIIPESLNSILMFFSTGAPVYYETVNEIIDDLNWFLDNFPYYQ